MRPQKYVIVTQRSMDGGILVLHHLCHLLNSLGMDARVLYFNKTDYDNMNHVMFWLNWITYNIKVSIKKIAECMLGERRIKGYFDIPNWKIKRKITPFITKNTIVIYSETMFGNPLKARKVVRLLLYYNRGYKKENGKTIGYEKSDLFFAYREAFNDSVLNPKNRILCTPYIDLDKYKRYNYGERHGKCYIIRKGKYRINANDCIDGIIIDDLSEREKVRVLNECEYCISYDTQTMYSQIAALCGCISVVIPEEGKKRKDYRGTDDDSYGEAFGFSRDEIDFAKSTANLIQKKWRSINYNSKQQVQKFITTCDTYFN